MKPSLIPEWQIVLRKAWSMRLMALAGFLTGCETVINVVGPDKIPVVKSMPAWPRVLLILGVIGGAFVTRLIAQKNIGVKDEQ